MSYQRLYIVGVDRVRRARAAVPAGSEHRRWELAIGDVAEDGPVLDREELRDFGG